ncbi:DNA repair protein [Ruegeria sp. HKCCA5014]|uniref:DNA repair protein n=1 Tax=Ruegeria sp. HKCCA5014 TaxID=2682980 RepID=UPI001489D918|nr:DNA repair protein [Ruegeria sp. HKCCA5014]
MATLHSITLHLQNAFMRATFALIIALAAGGVISTGLSAAGVLPWLSLQAGFGPAGVVDAGLYVQVGLTALALMLAFYLPSSARMMALENTHRRFAMNMQDVTQAYHLAHAADRSGLFRTSSEFDAVKERLSFLREHPDLQSLEPEILELAAQMSQVSQELADTFGDDKVNRARSFLQQRQQEVEQFQQRIEDAQTIQHELRQWTRDIEIEQSIAKSQLARLRDELFDLLPELSTHLRSSPELVHSSNASIYPMTPPRAAE